MSTASFTTLIANVGRIDPTKTFGDDRQLATFSVAVIDPIRQSYDLLGHLQKCGSSRWRQAAVFIIAQYRCELSDSSHASGRYDPELSHVSTYGVCGLASLTHEQLAGLQNHGCQLVFR